MPQVRVGVLVGVVALMLATSLVGCSSRTIVVAPRPARPYTARDTLWGQYKGNEVRVVFRFDTLWRTDTVRQLDTLWRAGTRTILRVDTLRLVRPDTVYRVDTVRFVARGRVDTVRVPVPVPVTVTTPLPAPSTSNPPRPTNTGQVPTRVARVDTVRIVVRDTVRVTGRDTVRITVRDTVRLTGRDTVRIIVRDTLRITVRDTVFRRDTVRVAGRRMLFVPPGQYPPEGQCRIWIHDLAPGRQADPAPCNALGVIPRGAFILFKGEAWDFDYDWISEAGRGSVPPEIVALKRRGRP